MFPLFAILTSVFCADVGALHFEGTVTADGGDYLAIPFTVPAGVVEVKIAHTDNSRRNVLDFGLWRADGTWRGWGGGNAEDIVIGTTAASRSYVAGPVEGDWELIVGKALIAESPAPYVVDVTFRDAPTITEPERAPWTDVTLAAGPRWVKGDFHVHSRESGDSRAELPAVALFARDRGLDFIVISDHNTITQHTRFAAMQAAYPSLLFVRGAEMTTYGGHGNALGVTTYIDHRVGFRGRTAAQVIDEIDAAGGVFIINHMRLAGGGACIGCQWVHADTPWDKVRGVELATGPYAFNERFVVPGILDDVDAKMDEGATIAFVTGSDDHDAGGGDLADMYYAPIGTPTTRVYAASLSEADVIAGVRAGRTVVNLRGPDDPTVDLTIQDLHGEDGGMIGDTVAASALRVTAHVVGGTAPETTIRVVQDGRRLPAVAVDSADVTHEWLIAVPQDRARTRVRLELEEDHRRVVVTSHAFATYEDGPGLPPPDGGGLDAGAVDALGAAAGTGGGGCGCRVAGRQATRTPIALAFVALFAVTSRAGRARARRARRPRA